MATSVADVLQRSKVSRQSFYQVFDSKLDCFMAAYDVATDLLVKRLLEMVGGVPGPEVAGGPLHRFERAFTAYLEAHTIELPYTRVLARWRHRPDLVRIICTQRLHRPSSRSEEQMCL